MQSLCNGLIGMYPLVVTVRLNDVPTNMEDMVID